MYTVFMELSLKKIVFGFSILLLIIIFFGLFFLFNNEEVEIETLERSDFGGTSTIGEQLGIDDITIPPQQQFTPTNQNEEGVRDDRVFVIPSQDSLDTLEGDGLESQPRLIRLFAGPTAGYRIDKNGNDQWIVRLVEKGSGNRFIVQTSPYSLDLVAAGEFTKVLESHLFSNEKVLVLYESPDDESVVKSAFVPFAPVGESNIQTFEDNVRVVSDNRERVFFIKKFDEKTLGLVVNTSRPEETEIVWESYFTNWIPQWGRNNHITLAAPISNSTKGYVYLIDPDGELPINRVADIPMGGSVFVDTVSGYFLLYQSEPHQLVGTTTITNQDGDVVIETPTTIPEKCDSLNGVFVCGVPNRVPARTLSGYETNFPDSWYQGDIVLSDSIVLVNAVTGEKQLLLAPNQEDIRILSGNRTFDIVNLRISDDGNLVLFMDKSDLSLWMLRL